MTKVNYTHVYSKKLIDFSWRKKLNAVYTAQRVHEKDKKSQNTPISTQSKL